MKKQVMSKTARRKLVLRAESVVTLSSRDLTAVAGGEIAINSPLGGCTGSPTKREPDPGA
jgi:hypothetical protein